MIGRLLFPAAASPAAADRRNRHFARGPCRSDGAARGRRHRRGRRGDRPVAAIGAGTIVAPNAVIGRLCQIGRDCYVGPTASIQYALIGNRVIVHGGAMIGQDGFGFVAGRARAGAHSADRPRRHPGRCRDRRQHHDRPRRHGRHDHRRRHQDRQSRADRPQCPDRARLHHRRPLRPVRIGDTWRLMRCWAAASASPITSRSAPARRSARRPGVMHDVPAGERWAGAPAVPMRDFFRQVAAIQALAKARKGDSNG